MAHLQILRHRGGDLQWRPLMQQLLSVFFEYSLSRISLEAIGTQYFFHFFADQSFIQGISGRYLLIAQPFSKDLYCHKWSLRLRKYFGLYARN
ncbi:unnamed protein product [Calypogeia fissa]